MLLHRKIFYARNYFLMNDVEKATDEHALKIVEHFEQRLLMENVVSQGETLLRRKNNY